MILPVLCYHKIERRRELGVTRLSPRRFATHIEALARAGWVGVSLADFAAVVSGRRAPGERELLITFDDGYRGLREHAFPVLRDAGFAAACFVITEYAGRLNRWDVAYGGRRFAHLAWRDIERWAAHGIAFESHTATHPRLSWVNDGQLGLELRGSRASLERALGAAPIAVAYPFGAVSARVAIAAREAGYSLGFGLAGQWRGDPLLIPRLPVHCWAPTVPGVGPFRAVERVVSGIAGRCAVGTAIWTSLTRRVAPQPTRRNTSPPPARALGA